MRGLMRRAGALLPVAALVAAINGCGSSSDGGTNPGDTPSIAISLSTSALSIVQGGNGQLTASITRNGGFTGTVNVVTQGAPEGVTASVSNVSTTGGTTTGTVTVSVAATVAAGSYPLTVEASGSGVSDATANFTLTVTAAPAAYTLTLSTGTVNVAAGESGTVQVSLGRTNFTGAVTLALEGAPEGVTGSFDPAAPTANTSTLTLQVGASVTPATYQLTVRGTAEGLDDRTATLSLTVATASTGSFSLAITGPQIVTVNQGLSGTATIAINRTNFTQAVALTLEGAPTGVTGQFNPGSTTGNSSTLTLNIGGAVAVGEYTLTVRGTSQGQSDQTVQFALNVTVAQDYSIATVPSGSISIQQGEGKDVAINLTRTGGFTGVVTFSVTGVPNGLTPHFNPASTNGNTATLTLTASNSLAAGNYQISIKGDATGLTQHSADLTVTITSSGPSGGSIAFNYTGCDASEIPVWFAVQDGNGAWTQVVPSGNTFSFDINSSKGGIAIVTNSGGTYALAITYFSKAEIQSFGSGIGSSCASSATGKTIHGSVAGLGITQQAAISLGGATGSATFASTAFNLIGVSSGQHDLIALTRSLGAFGTIDKMIIRRDQNPADGATLSALDFSSGEAFTAGSATITVGGLSGGETTTGFSSYLTGASCDVTSLALHTISGNSFTLYGVPAGQQRATDWHSVTVTATDGASSSRLAIKTFQALGAQTITLGSVLPNPTITPQSGPYKRLQFQFTAPAEYGSSVSLSYFDPGSSGVIIAASVAGYLGGNAVNLTVPDFTGVGGWNNAYAPAAASTVTWTTTAASGVGTSNCAAGQLTAATRNGSL